MKLMAFGDIIWTNPELLLNPNSLAFDGKYFYSLEWVSGDILQIDPVSGYKVREIAQQGWGATCSGLTFDGKQLWLADYGVNPSIYAINPITLQIVYVFTSPVNNPYIYHDRKQLWICPYTGGGFSLVDPISASIRRTVNLPTVVNPCQIASDGKNFYIVDTNDGNIVQFDPVTGAEIRRGATGLTAASGLCFDGKALWVTCTNTDRMHQISLW